MQSSTITAFLLPLLLSSVLAVPTPVQNKAATQSGPPAAQVSLSDGLLKSGHLVESEWVRAGSPGRKRSIIGVEPTPAVSPENLDPEAGISPEQQDIIQGMESEDEAQAQGQDPELCDGPCTPSLKGRQDDPEAATTPATDPN